MNRVLRWSRCVDRPAWSGALIALTLAWVAAGCSRTQVVVKGAEAHAVIGTPREPDRGATPPDAAPSAAPRDSRLDDLRVRVRAFTTQQIQRGDRPSVDRALSAARTEARTIAAAADTLNTADNPARGAEALALVGVAFERLAELEAQAPELLVLSPEQQLAQTRAEEEASRLEAEAHRRRRRTSTAARLLAQAARIRSRSATLLQASTALARERADAAAREARFTAVRSYGRAAWKAQQHGVLCEEVARAVARLTDPAMQTVVSEALRDETEFTYRPGMFEPWIGY